VKARTQQLYLWLILAQAAHSIEEYLFRLYDVFAPARWISSVFSPNPRLGFALANASLVLLGLWCYFTLVRTARASGRTWAWFWTLLEGTNGLGHLAFAVGERGYFPGAATAPILLGLSVMLGMNLSRTAEPEGVTCRSRGGGT
jgi:Protein of unknown function with HXXEE motif